MVTGYLTRSICFEEWTSDHLPHKARSLDAYSVERVGRLADPEGHAPTLNYIMLDSGTFYLTTETIASIEHALFDAGILPCDVEFPPKEKTDNGQSNHNT